MAWIEPKTDWETRFNDSGLYMGDFFNVTDYNRIKNNLMYLKGLADDFIGAVPTITVGADKHLPNATPDFENDHFFADEINLIENGLQTLGKLMPYALVGNKQTFYENGRFIDYEELNRIESAELRLYNILNDSIKGKLRLPFRLGMRGNTIRV